MSVRSRFAPSPTGVLHVGSVRTALFAWAYARKHQGAYLLRIEDTDLTRSTKESIEAIFKGLSWLDLNSDEEPVYQTHRFDRYHQLISQLIREGKAYYCNCSKERLERLRDTQMAQKEKPKYDGHCRALGLQPKEGEDYVVRFKMPEEGVTTFIDEVYGEISTKNSELDDFIIQRSDGSPTYNFCVVVDDSDLKISHVIRGDDHINNTPKQINLYKALGMETPTFAHLPMILGEDGKRLSKRHGAVGVEEFKEQGILPEALLNYLVRLGWSHGDQEIFSKEDICQLFSLSSVGKSNAVFDYGKLLWLNQHYMKTLPSEALVGPLLAQFKSLGIDVSNGPPLSVLIPVMAERVQTLKELAKASLYFYSDEFEVDQSLQETFLVPEKAPLIHALIEAFSAEKEWTVSQINQCLSSFLEAQGLKLGKVGPMLRVALTGSKNSPSLDQTLFLIGQERVCQRLKKALSHL
jgi:glutamyl-tRNA synthetase